MYGVHADAENLEQKSAKPEYGRILVHSDVDIQTAAMVKNICTICPPGLINKNEVVLEVWQSQKCRQHQAQSQQQQVPVFIHPS